MSQDIRLKASLQFKTSLMMSSGVQANFLSGLYSNRYKDCPYMSCCGAFSKVVSSCLVAIYRASGKGVVLVLNDSKSKGWEEIGNISLESCSQMLEDPVYR